jgi:hypothetical protein
VSSPLSTGLFAFDTRADALRIGIVDSYLLGSGGTLVFDLTIMIQSLIYGSAPPIDERDQEDYIEPQQQHHHHRSRSSRRHSKRITDEESRPLIERPDEE